MVSLRFFFVIDESQLSASRRSPISPPIDHSLKGKFVRRAQQVNFIFVNLKKNIFFRSRFHRHRILSMNHPYQPMLIKHQILRVHHQFLHLYRQQPPFLLLVLIRLKNA